MLQPETAASSDGEAVPALYPPLYSMTTQYVVPAASDRPGLAVKSSNVSVLRSIAAGLVSVAKLLPGEPEESA